VNWIAGIVLCRTSPPGLINGRQRKPSWAGAWKTRQSASCRVVAGNLLSLGKLAVAEGEQTKAQDYLRGAATKTLTADYAHHTLFGGSRIRAQKIYPRRISEIVRAAYTPCRFRVHRNNYLWVGRIGRN